MRLNGGRFGAAWEGLLAAGAGGCKAWLVAAAMLAAPVDGGAQGIVWDLLAPPAPTTAVYFTSADGGQLGVPVITGDFNGDGFPDVAAAPFNASTMGRSRNGIAEIFFGDGSIGATVDTATYQGPRLVIHGAAPLSLLGVEVAAADLDGDGFADLVLGSSHGVHIAEAERAGEVVILFGREEWGASVRELDLAALPAEQRVGFVVGERNRMIAGSGLTGDRLGSWFTVDDLDGSGGLDLVMGMDQSWGPGNNRNRCGAVVILWDAAEALGGAAPSTRLRVGEEASAEHFTVIYGRDAGDMLGSTNFAGDLDGDGLRDLVVSAGVNRSGLGIGALNYVGVGGGAGPLNNRSLAGEVTVFWNAGALRARRTLDLRTQLDAVAHTVLYGERANDYFGEELYVADVTGDGVDDLIVGALGFDPPGLSLAGATYLVQGGELLRSQMEIDLAAPSGPAITAFDGTEVFSISGDTVEAADINGDGAADLFLGIPYGTPRARFQAGYTTVIFGGQEFPVLPQRVQVGMFVNPPLLHTLILGADSPNNRGDYLAYSTAVGDVDGDGVADYIPNAMQGDGFQNAYMNAGEFYILSGDMIARLAAAPTNPRRLGNGGATWDAAQGIFGPVTGYRVGYELGGEPGFVEVEGVVLEAGMAPAGALLVDVRSVMERRGVVNVSAPALFRPVVPFSWMLE